MTWSRCLCLVAALSVGLLASSVAVRADYYSGAAELPSPMIRESPNDVMVYNNGVMVRNMLMIRESPTADPLPPPGPGTHCDSFFDIFTEVSTDGGGSWGNAQQLNSFFDIFTTNGGGGGGGATNYATEVMSMDLTLSMPSGATIMIRESPTRASGGTTSVTPLSSEGYMISSFFDIWTELSLDGGQSWIPSQTAARFDGLPEPSTLGLLALGALGLVARRGRRKGVQAQ
jgi:hypothetical protein